MKSFYFLFLIVACSFITACDSNKSRIAKTMEQMKSAPIMIHYDKLDVWASDSIKKISPWKHAKLKLVHYIDSVQCSSCYLTKIPVLEPLLDLEKESNNQFYNIFVVYPGDNVRNWKTLKSDYKQKMTPATLFVDSLHVFMDKNPNLPQEVMFHTFLLDENNNVVFVGSPFDANIRNKTITIIKQRLSSSNKD